MADKEEMAELEQGNHEMAEGRQSGLAGEKLVERAGKQADLWQEVMMLRVAKLLLWEKKCMNVKGNESPTTTSTYKPPPSPSQPPPSPSCAPPSPPLCEAVDCGLFDVLNAAC
ncbi:hypothetical protein PAMP_002851 [Pampus punctatissimus]